MNITIELNIAECEIEKLWNVTVTETIDNASYRRHASPEIIKRKFILTT